MLGQIAANVAHELKNKLNVINAAVYGLSQEHVTADRRERTRLRVEQTITATARLISDLLQLARPQQSAPGPVDVADVLEPILDAVVPATVSVRRRIPSGLPTVRADRQQVEQVLLNVVINAVEAMPHGGTLDVALQLQDDQMRLTITDSGTGIAAADLPKVFETFWTTKPQGSGLGLSISRSLIEQHGGSIQLATGNDRGTRVVIQLPTIR
jgi:signal transduction histidine kinase